MSLTKLTKTQSLFSRKKSGLSIALEVAMLKNSDQVLLIYRQAIKIIGLFLLLTLSTSVVHAFQCRDIFYSKNAPIGESVQSSTGSRKVPLYSHITEQNIEALFSHNYDWRNRSRFGCKAVVTHLPGEPPRVYFFPTGSKAKNWNIHHVDAIAVALNDSTGQLFYTFLPHVQGYQMTAQMVRGRLRIVELDISSTLTYVHEMSSENAPSREQDLAMLNALILSIDVSLREFPFPALPDYLSP